MCMAKKKNLAQTDKQFILDWIDKTKELAFQRVETNCHSILAYNRHAITATPGRFVVQLCGFLLTPKWYSNMWEAKVALYLWLKRRISRMLVLIHVKTGDVIIFDHASYKSLLKSAPIELKRYRMVKLKDFPKEFTQQLVEKKMKEYLDRKVANILRVNSWSPVEYVIPEA